MTWNPSRFGIALVTALLAVAASAAAFPVIDAPGIAHETVYVIEREAAPVAPEESSAVAEEAHGAADDADAAWSDVSGEDPEESTDSSAHDHDRAHDHDAHHGSHDGATDAEAPPAEPDESWDGHDGSPVTALPPLPVVDSALPDAPAPSFAKRVVSIVTDALTSLGVDFFLPPEAEVLDFSAPSEPSTSTAPEATTASVGAPRSAGAPSLPPAFGVAVLAATTATALGWVAGAGSQIAPLWKRILGLIGVGAFTRLEREGLFEHDARDRLYALIRESPGASLQELVADIGAGRNAVTYHLRVLEREGFVTSRREGRRRLYFPAGATGVTAADSAVCAALAHETARAIAEGVAAAPGLDQQSLCRAVGVQPSLAHWHVERLEKAGLVERVKEGRRVRYFPGPQSGKFV